MELLTERNKEKIAGSPGCYDGLVFTGTLSGLCYSEGMTIGRTYLRGATSKCLHYYFYFQDKEIGYGYIRVPTWCPFRFQIYINGHNLLSSELDRQAIKYHSIDNA